MAAIQSLSSASAAKTFGEMCGKFSTHGTSHATLSEMSRCSIWSLYPRFYQEAWAQRMLEQGHQEECGEQLGTKDCRLGQVHCLRPLGLAQFLFMEMSQSCNAQPSVHCAGCWRWVYRCTEDIVVWYIEGGLWKAGFWPRGLRQIWELHSMLGMLLPGATVSRLTFFVVTVISNSIFAQWLGRCLSRHMDMEDGPSTPTLSEQPCWLGGHLHGEWEFLP